MGLMNILHKFKKDKRHPVETENAKKLKETGNPFLLARAEYEDRYGSVVKDVAKWRQISLSMIFMCILFGISMIWLSAQNKVVPYIVQIDRHGYAVSIKSAEQSSVADTRIVIATLGRVIMDFRTIVSDSKAQEKLISGVYACIAKDSEAQAAIDQYYKENNPFLLVKERKIGRMVNINSITPFTAGGNGTSWLINWMEQTTNEGRVVSASTYRAIVKIAISPVRELDQVLANPIGLYITELNITKDMI